MSQQRKNDPLAPYQITRERGESDYIFHLHNPSGDVLISEHSATPFPPKIIRSLQAKYNSAFALNSLGVY